MTEMGSKLKVIKIIDPVLCVRCDYAYVADVMLANGSKKKMFYCSRLDCDNWMASEGMQEVEVRSQTQGE